MAINNVKDPYGLNKKVAIITGGTGVLGGVMAEGLATYGTKVVVLGRSESKAGLVIKKIEKSGGEAMPAFADVLNEKSLNAVKNTVLNKWGRIDILINAAGGNLKSATLSPEMTVFDLPKKGFENVIDLNLMGKILPTQVFGSVMAEKNEGSIINISSMAADRAITRVVGYSAAKAAVENYTKWMAAELALKFGDGIRVNAIAPGFFIGEQNKQLLLNNDGTLTGRGQAIINKTPMQRFGEPEELISTVLWLCSEYSKFITGVIVAVDGGFSAYSGV